jgi:hypothetical protein
MKRNSEGELLLKGWTLKEIASVVFIFAIISGIAGNTLYQNHLESQQKKQRIQILQLEVIEYKAKLKTCVKANDVFPLFYGDNPRSEERIVKVVRRFTKILAAECFVFRTDRIYTNPYKNLALSNIGETARTENQEEIFQCLLYEVDKGIPFLTTGGSICSDGSYSSSVGRGTCSWHGGYASQRGYQFEFKASVREPDPRIALNRLLE